MVDFFVEPNEHVSCRHQRMIAHPHLGDASRNLGGNLRDVGLHEGILGRGVAPALEPERQRSDNHERRHADQRHWP